MAIEDVAEAAQRVADELEARWRRSTGDEQEVALYELCDAFSRFAEILKATDV